MTKKLLKIIIALLVLCVIIYLVFGIFKVQDKIKVYLYPKKYSEYVEKYSKAYNIDPLLVYAIIKAESNFKPDVISKSNAMGLMQLMKTTASDTAKKIGVDFEEKMLLDPEINIKLGTKHFSLLYENYNNISLALTAYNAGVGNVDKWVSDGIIDSKGTNIEKIPFRETNNYVRKILRDYEIYKKIYK